MVEPVDSVQTRAMMEHQYTGDGEQGGHMSNPEPENTNPTVNLVKAGDNPDVI